MNIIDKFTSSGKSFVVKECDLLTTLKMFRSLEIDKLELSGYQFSGKHDLWLIEIEVTKKQWITILKYCVDNKYRLVIKIGKMLCTSNVYRANALYFFA